MVKISAKVHEERLAHVVAGGATNDTFLYYIEPQDFRKVGLQFEWTAGATGTVTVTVQGSVMPLANGSTPGDATTITYRDITNAVFGVANWTDDFIAVDNAERLACFSAIRVSVVTLTVDANTAWDLYLRQVS